MFYLRIVFIVGLSFSVAVSQAQTFFQTYTSGNKLEGACVIPAPDGNLFVGGGKDDSAFVMKIDPFGQIIWTLAFRSSAATTPLYVTSLELTPDNFLIGSGVGLTPSNLYPADAFYFKATLTGNVVFCNAVEGLPYRFTIRKMLSLTSSSYLIVGAHEEQTGTWYDPTILRVDGITGAITSQSPRYDFQNQYLDDISESILSPDKSHIYSTGRLYVNGASPDQMRIFLTKFDTLGALLWTKFFVYSTSGTARMYGSNVLYDNDTLVIANFGDNNGTSSNFELGILKSDTAGNMLWAKNFNITSTTYERSFRLLKTSYGYAIIGVCTSTSNDLFILALDSQGNVLWCKSYGTAANEDHVQSYGSLPATRLGNDIFFIGVERTTASQHKLIVARTDVDGNLSCLAPTDLTVVTTVNPVYTEQRVVSSNVDPVSFAPVSVFTNPFVPVCLGYELDLGNDTSLCAGSIVLDATISGADYLWQDGSTYATLEPASAGAYSVTVSVDCCILQDSIDILGLGQINTNQTFSLCNGDSMQIGGLTFYSDATFTDTLISATGCDSIVQISIAFNAVPDIQINAPDTVCSGATIQLAASGAEGYLWTPTNGIACATCATTTLTTDFSSTYVVTGSNNGCEDFDSVYVTVLARPEIEILQPQFMPCQPEVQLVVQGEGNYQYQWSPADAVSNAVSDSATVFLNGTVTFTVTAIDSNGCLTIDEIEVNNSEGGIVAIPNAFSPNSDGINDLFRLIFLCPIELEYFRVYNRWGQLLFETAAVDQGWNGMYKMKNCDLGVYVYVAAGVVAGGQPFFLKGNVTLMR
jgi:gliding motility-associated-like protein